MRTIIISLLATMLAHALHAQPKIRVALVQSAFEWGNVEANLRNFDQKVCSIKGCHLIVLPELFISGCDMRKKSKEKSIRTKDAIAAHYDNTIEQMRQWAKATDAVIVGSTIYKEGNCYFNRLLAVRPSGDYDVYDKRNCFKRGSFTPGEDHLVIKLNERRFATYICYDLRFPEWSKNNGRYDTAIYIANWTQTTAADWNCLLRERAKENKAHVIAVNCVGNDKAGKTFMGDSQVIAPDGKILAKAQEMKEEIIIVEY